MRPLLFLLFTATPAYAQLSLNRFEAAPAGDRLFGVSSADVGEHLTFGARVTPDWAHNPLVLHDDQQTLTSVVRHQVFAHLGLSFSLWNRLLISTDLPLALVQSGASPSGIQSPSGVSVGELRLGLRARLFSVWDGLLTMGVGAFVWVPLSPVNASYASDGDVRGKLQLLFSGRRDRFFWQLAPGIDMRREQRFLEVAQGSMLRLDAGMGVLLLSERQLQLGPELSVALTVAGSNHYNTNAEALLGARYYFLNHIEVGVGGGAGLATGIGTPDFRVVASFGYSFTFGRDKPILVEQDTPAEELIAEAYVVRAPLPSVPEASAPAVERPTRIDLREQIQFATNSDVILKRSSAILEALLAHIQALPPGERLRIEGHTDNRGSAVKNRTLSEARARAVVRWLVAHGVDEARFESLGYGPDRPLLSNHTPKGRFQNRRVEIHVLH